MNIIRNTASVVLAFCLFVAPAAAIAGLLGGTYGSLISPAGEFWGAVGLGGLVTLIVSAFLILDAAG